MSGQDIMTRPYNERMAQARRDAERAAAICYLPVRERHAATSVGDWLQHRYDDIMRPELSGRDCADREISAKPAWYHVRPFSEETREEIHDAAQRRAAIGAARGQRRDRVLDR